MFSKAFFVETVVATNRLSAPSGQLRLELAKENYERSGLLGKAISDGGRKHVKTRYGMSRRAWRMLSTYHDVSPAVVIDLRQPSMLHGKRGFERIVWAFKNVLNYSVTWLFYDFDLESDREWCRCYLGDGEEGSC